MKKLLIPFLAFACAAVSFASEPMLTRTFQPLDGLGSGELMIAPVICYDQHALSGLPTAIGLITAKNVPPTNATGEVEDINAASMCGLRMTYDEDAAGHLTVTLDCRTLEVPTALGCTELQIVGITLECLRKVAGPKLGKMPLKVLLKPGGQEAIQKLVSAFIKHPKDKPFPWK